jgi:xanthine dehydrogenase YagR molybdenum-binding subunit
MRDGDRRVGWGMATAFYPQRRQGAAAKAVVTADGRAVVSSGTHDVGSGSYTVMTQFAADALGLPPDRVRFDLGDTRMPPAPVTGGSWTTVSVGPAVIAAATAVKKKLIEMAIADASSPLHGAKADEVVAADGKVSLKSDADKSDSYSDILSRARSPHVEAAGKSGEGAEKDKFSFESFGAQFAEVKVDALGQVRVTRFVGVFDTGKIVNPKTARSQLIGGITMGIGMALMEQTVYDPRRGKVVTDDLAEYRLPVNADVPDIDVAFIDQPDPHMEPAGAHGLGEIGITGVAAAVANAVYHATGRRVRDLPIAPEKLL